MKFNWPLMDNNITKEDRDAVIEFLSADPIVTQSSQVRAFESEWSQWLGVKHSVFVNSGASANLLTISALKYLRGSDGNIIVPPLTWVSDIASVMQCGYYPAFVDINPATLCMDTQKVIDRLNSRTKAVFLTHVQGFNGLTRRLLEELDKRKIPLIEDVCEAHGATFEGKKLGNFGLASNFSFYYAHHMSTVEGGMICTNDDDVYHICRMLRSHGMVRESDSDILKKRYAEESPDLTGDFIFAFPGYNVRSTEMAAVIGRNQLKRLDQNNEKRRENFSLFLKHLDPEKYRTDFDLEGSCNYAFNLVMKQKDESFRQRLEETMRENLIEFRRGSSGGGNQLRQPYLKYLYLAGECEKYPNMEHIHFFGYYIGNYPTLSEEKIIALCEILNSVQ